LRYMCHRALAPLVVLAWSVFTVGPPQYFMSIA
jgi:hypothetical protein